MISNFKERFNLSSIWKYLIHNDSYNEELCYSKELSKIQIKSFSGINKVYVSHLDIPEIELQFPINVQIIFDVNCIEEEIKRFSSFYHYLPFVKSKYKRKRLIIYHNNPMLLALLDYIIGLKNYTEYHIFNGSNESKNILNYLNKKYNIRINDVEDNINCMFRLCRNDYDDIYNEIDKDKYDHKIVFFSKENSLYEIATSIKWLSNFYISMPYNNFSIKLLQHTFKDFNNIKIVSNYDNYCILHITNISNRNNITTQNILDNINKWWKKHRKSLMPMKYKK